MSLTNFASHSIFQSGFVGRSVGCAAHFVIVRVSLGYVVRFVVVRMSPDLLPLSFVIRSAVFRRQTIARSGQVSEVQLNRAKESTKRVNKIYSFDESRVQGALLLKGQETAPGAIIIRKLRKIKEEKENDYGCRLNLRVYKVIKDKSNQTVALRSLLLQDRWCCLLGQESAKDSILKSFKQIRLKMLYRCLQIICVTQIREFVYLLSEYCATMSLCGLPPLQRTLQLITRWKLKIWNNILMIQ
ncbi:uncharacterized protein LOC120075269 [Benincasa hispida]|uniref:uncharacterized protein LOC120075269 n=1 Tax=Benincasa hispida TaxID=102211 RepID=UPI001902002D|nr:uncharacterized protein LOC120075269 [Benincasa hispida]